MALAVAHRGKLDLTVLWTAAGVVIFLLAPRASPALVLLAPLAPLAWCWATTKRLPWHWPSRVTLVLLLAAFYLLLNASWSQSRALAALAVATLLLIVLAVDTTVAALGQCPAPVVRALAMGLVAGVLLGSAYVCVEVFSGQWLRRMLLMLLPSLQPGETHLRVEAGQVTFLAPHLLNRTAMALTLLLWPALLVVHGLISKRKQRLLVLLGILSAVVGVLLLEHATSKLALIGAATIYGICYLSLPAARRLVTVSWVAATLLVVPVTALAFKMQLYRASWLFPSAQQRLVIWGYTSEQVPNAPLLGVGVYTAHALNDPYAIGTERAPGSSWPMTTGAHSHNGYLQAWYESGGIGALFLLGIGLMLLRSVSTYQPVVQPYLYATFVSCAVAGGSSFNLWEPWFMASFGFVAIFAALGAQLVAPVEQFPLKEP